MPRCGRTVAGTMPVRSLEAMFSLDPDLTSVVVTLPGSEPVCLSRAAFFAELTGPIGFGRSMYARQQLLAMPKPPTLIVAAALSVVEAAHAALARPGSRRYDDFIVAFDDGGFGTMCVADLFAELAHMHAFNGLHDALTGLANRHMFIDRLHEQAASDATDPEPPAIAVLFVDVDDFKTINDALGHDVGNEVLITVAARLKAAVGPHDTVARLGGDEFGVLLQRAPGGEAVLKTVEEIVATLAQPLWVDDKKVALSASVGVALGVDERAAEPLLRNADIAMYAAKRRQKGCYRFYEPGMHEEARELLDLKGQLHGALERGELFLLYQPIVGLASGEIVGAEALLRWRRPGADIVAPATFIPLCEQTGLIGPIGRWVLEEACRHAVRWESGRGSRTPLKLSVNVSPRQLRDAGFVDSVARTLASSGFAAENLVLEITEGVFIRDMAIVLKRLDELKRMGVRLALDDFGAGFSSLGYLSQMPIDILKLDRAFVSRLGTTDERGLLAGVVALANSLALVTVAEGVETTQQVAELSAAGCATAQGFFFSRPIEALMLGRLAAGPALLPLAGVHAGREARVA